MLRHACWGLVLLVVSGCADLSPEIRRHNAEHMAAGSEWEPLRLQAGPFVLAAFAPRHLADVDTLTVYVEGDGLSWITRSQPSQDPTPMHAMALAMALQQPRGTAAYLARPCQYVSADDARNCRNTWWTDSRFAAEVITATNLAIDQLKQRFRARHLVLVGYSGGGAVVTLATARRKDVSLLVSVAGNLDPEAWARINKITPLKHSLNPPDAWQDLVDVPQLHFVGARDITITPEVAYRYAARFPKDRQPALRIIEGFDHQCCWAEKWAELYPGPP
ncbi:MAG: alpha/beta hydrolase [bacterium]|nr:alpha/beta hydrolase [bacterium]